jgi:hypothetical protein
MSRSEPTTKRKLTMQKRTALTVRLVAAVFLVIGFFLVGCRTTTTYTFTVSPVILGTESETRAKTETTAEQGKVVEVPTDVGRAASAAVGPAAQSGPGGTVAPTVKSAATTEDVQK